ncbi:MAG: lamin tail domain-containing protein, partial [Candidatus Aenigmarchaeota archaeon]|nr:lamin tail domain-containing protein [Candidatus Aenigmarchaeota archaeon]
EIFDEEKCLCEKVISCCGNGICEAEEILESCPDDCPASIIFTEVLYDSEKPENKKEWFEIYNPADVIFDLTGYSVSDNDYRWEFPEGTLLDPEDYIVVARDAGGFYEEYGCYPDISGFSRTMNNDGDILVLEGRGGKVIDTVSWEGFADGWDIFADESKTIKRNGFTDSDSSSDWMNNKTATPAGCDEIVCRDSEKTCDDGYTAICKNSVIWDDCTDCEPDCTGHEKGQCEESWVCSGWGDCTDGTEERECTDLNSCGSEKNKPEESRECFLCNITCGTCEELSNSECLCETIIPCEGNGLCEEGEQGEPDCPGCDDNDACTNDYYNYTEESCSYEDVVPCCGNGICEEGENSTLCENDCEINGTCNNISLHLMFAEVMYDTPGKETEREWIKIYNPLNETVNLAGWRISDNSGNWSFPEGLSLGSGSYFTIARKDYGFFEMFNCSPSAGGLTLSLSNTGDELTLRNSENEKIDFVSWENYMEGWDIQAGENKIIKRISNGDGPENWISDQEPEPSCT